MDYHIDYIGDPKNELYQRTSTSNIPEYDLYTGN